MNPFFQENDINRREALLAASEIHPEKLPAYIIEKDFYVTSILQILYVEIAPQLVSQCQEPFIFKGGTSLSKCYGLIARMSEDIDLSFSMELFGATEINRQPMRGRGKMHDEAQAIDNTAREFVKDVLIELITNSLMKLDKRFRVEIESDEPLNLAIFYPSVIEEGEKDAVLRRVLLETGSLSQNNPVEKIHISHMLGDYIPGFKEAAFPVVALKPERTLLEKMFAVHCNLMAETKRPKYSRHLYDILKLHNTDNSWCENKEMMDELVEFCDIHYKIPKAQCNSARQGPLILSPTSQEMLKHYEKDWLAMSDMFPFGTLPSSFEVLLNNIRTLEAHVNKVYYKPPQIS
ncbi:nucleotidyl transferase AbiEii/AbiGii toxin family protein [Shewanella algae]|uniref:nucleotidyl transferase AbiEii/AbiGii toxin family protein n=1 Tax=Shewanella algae TaxID=38313 RepID=UPI0012DBD2D5|nr:nucleotidyl transferase AbiEii/AbiGii toxin family protein [Shewanella algae]QGS60575.1 nucleotidyl transferase AbiEii/AbiGii toxin family protein [Shewanella algae]